MTQESHLDNLKTAFPVFQSNQVLTAGHLNNVINYLEQQDRLERVCFIGMGIACGLEVQVDGAAITIKAGYGITSQGYLVKTGELNLTHFRSKKTIKEFFGYGDTDPCKNFWQDENTPPPSDQEPEFWSKKPLDLLTKAEFPQTDFELTTESFKDRVLALVLECQLDDKSGLCHNDCDAKGAEMKFILHPLLLDKADADAIIRENYQKVGGAGDTFASLEELFHFKLMDGKGDQPYLERFGYLEIQEAGEPPHVARLHDIFTYDIFQARYRDILTRICNRLEGTLNTAHKILSPVFSPQFAPGTPLGIHPVVKDSILNGIGYHRFEAQYLYDYLCDLANAYEEWVETVFDLVAECPPDICRFPNHLWLAEFDGSNNVVPSPTSPYRTPFVQPPFYNGNRQRLEEARTLFERLKLLTQLYLQPKLLGNDVLKITPDRTLAHPLSLRAVPYYYGDNAALRQNWNPRRRRMNRLGQAYGYHRASMSPYDDPLVFQMEGNDFLRIEGHIGKDFREVLSELDKLRLRYNLPFEIVALKIGDSFNEEVFQFQCEDIECKQQEYRMNYISERERMSKTITDLLATQDLTSSQKTTLEGLNSLLVPTLDEFNLPGFEALYNSYLQNLNVPPATLSEHGAEPLHHLRHCFDETIAQLEEVKLRHLFYHFAEVFPGMAHKSGTTLGGTFILAYVEPELVTPAELQPLINEINQTLPPETRQTAIVQAQQASRVVADFYLPYSCISCCPPICYVVSRPKPILVVSPTVFCEGDASDNVLIITMFPTGGQIELMAGYRFENNQHLFVPADSQPDANNEIRLHYVVDGASAEAVLKLVPPPDASFNLVRSGQNITSFNICKNAGTHLLSPATGGIYTATKLDGTPLPNAAAVLANDAFNPEAVDLEGGESITIKIRRVVDGAYCDGAFEREVTICRVPDAAFDFVLDNVVITEVCQGGEDLVLLRPQEQAGTHGFEAFIDNVPGVPPVTITEDLIVKIGNEFFFNPAGISLNQQPSVSVRIVHTITGQSACGCQATAQKNISVHRQPNPAFTVNPATVCKNGDPVQLKPVSTGGIFKAFIGTDDVSAAISQSPTGAQFDPNHPSVVIPANADSVLVIIHHEMAQGPCAAIAPPATLVVTKQPVASFQAEFAPQPAGGPTNLVFVNVTNIQPVGAAVYEWNSNVQPASNFTFPTGSASSFQVPYFPGDAQEQEIILTLRVGTGGCFSEPFEVIVPPLLLRFDLWRVRNETLQSVVTSLSPTGDNPISLEELEGFPFFNIQAVTLPVNIGKVDFALTGQQTESHTSIVDGNYRLVENAPPAPLGLLPQPGSYQLKATPFGESGTEGKSLQVNFTILENLIPQPPGDVVITNEDRFTFLRRRDTTRRDELRNLETDAALADTEAFRLTRAFLNMTTERGLADTKPDLDAFNAGYAKAIDALLQSTKGVRKTAPRFSNTIRLMMLATLYFMDRHVVENPKRLAESAKKPIADRLPAMKKIGLDVQALKLEWRADALKMQLTAPTVDVFLKVLGS